MYLPSSVRARADTPVLHCPFPAAQSILWVHTNAPIYKLESSHHIFGECGVVRLHPRVL